jgi:hypothetical protein
MLVLLLLLAGPGVVPIDVETYWIPERESRFSFHAAGKELCSFRGRAPAGQNSTAGTCRLELPAGTRQLTVKGTYTVARWDAGTNRTRVATATGAQDFVLRDGSSLTAPLRDTALGVKDRWQRVADAERRLVSGWDGYPLLQWGAAARDVDLKEAAARLGYPLPTGYQDLVTRLGTLQFGDNQVPPPSILVPARTTILKEWSYGDGGRRPSWLDAETDRLLARSVILFFEVGDGMGGALFLPPPNDRCGQGWASTTFHEESLAEDMGRLAAGGMDCTGFEQRLRDAFQAHVFDAQAAELADETGEVLIDEGAEAQRLHLRYGTGSGDGFAVDLARE